ncbi:hypothetical protein AVEN_167742-1 [Araneus ventricosus]|uniref:General transcription factor II-I repeat domain-containing protein 2 n=1 Tax=Araneus ventricosus TaxID=182803 RepID=A0A4Y2NL87_ARAVE|nr:hypothetical protein AVEN_167742-1 [Araneus ventricosus]
MLEDTEWLSDFAFFTDLLCHMNNLNVKMQGKNQFIDDIWAHLKAFKLKLNLLAGQLAKNDLSHFARLNSIPSVNEEKLKNYEDGLKKLHFEFERRFQDFSAIHSELDIFTMPFNVNCEAVRYHPDECPCPASEVSSSQPVAPLHCFGSDVPIVLTSMQEKGESLMRQDQGCRPGDPMSTIPGDEYVICVPCCVGILHYRPKTKPSAQEPW